ncbi:EamA family transporter [Ornithinimicrobium sp. Arc0846-15]|nr:EamA family transporter [Ornithinimicrobium laminariae]
MTASRAVWAVLAAAILFGTTGTAQALGPTDSSPLSVGAARLVIGGIALLVLLPLVGGRRREALNLWRTPGGLVAGLCTAAYQLAFFAAVEQSGVAVGTLIAIGSGPVLAGGLGLVLLRERPSPAWVVATALALVGLVLLVGGGSGAQRVDALGIGLALVAAMAYAGYTVLAKQQITAGDHPSTVIAAAFGLGGIVLIPVMFTGPLGWLGQPSGPALALYLGLIATTVAYLLFVRGLAVLPAAPVTTLMLAEPVVATTLGVVVLHEQLSLISATGVALMLLGLVVQGRGASQPPEPTAARGQTTPLPVV